MDRFLVIVNETRHYGYPEYSVFDTTLDREVCCSDDRDDAKYIAGLMSKHAPLTAAEKVLAEGS